MKLETFYKLKDCDEKVLTEEAFFYWKKIFFHYNGNTEASRKKIDSLVEKFESTREKHDLESIQNLRKIFFE